MARITVEDCIDKVSNRFELVLLARLCTFLCSVTERLGESLQECGWNFHHVAVFPRH